MGANHSAPVQSPEVRTAGMPGAPSSSKPWAFTDNSIQNGWAFSLKESVQCLCEGGRACTREDPACQRPGGAAAALTGLHASWVGTSVLAMARPWQDNIIKHGIVARLRQEGIGMILNLCEVGEHAGCGPGLLPTSGFTYSPETFMEAKIGFYNFSWRDMGVPTLDKMMDIVQVMHYVTSVEGRKVAVHCHAGLGRTGLAVACFLVFDGAAASAADAIKLVRACRPGSLETVQQETFVHVFEQYLQHLRCLFRETDLSKVNLLRESYAVSRLSRKISRLGELERAPSGGVSQGGGHSRSTSAETANALAASATTASTSMIAGEGQEGQARRQSYVACTTMQSSYTCVALERAAQAAREALERGGSIAAAASTETGSEPASSSGGVEREGAPVAVVVPLAMPGKSSSGGAGGVTLVTNLAGVDSGAPLHVIKTEAAVAETYVDGLTIVKASRGTAANKHTATTGDAAKDTKAPSREDLGLDKPLPWNEHFTIQPDAFVATGFTPQPPASYMEALRRQKRLMHGVERRQSLRLHKMLKEAATALGGAAGLYKHSASGAGPCFAQAVLACLQHRGRLSEDAQIADWARIPQVQTFGMSDVHALLERVHSVKLDLNMGKYLSLAAAPAAVVLVVLEDWFRSFRSEALSTRALEAMVEDAEALLAGPAGAEPDAEADLQQIQHDRRIVTVCEAFTAAERELVLVLAALMRHSLFSSCSEEEPIASEGGVGNDVMPVADAAVQQLCRHTAGWLLGPLARETSAASVAVTSAVSTFMWWLVVDDDGYRALLQTKQTGVLSRRPSCDSMSELIGSGLALYSPVGSRSCSPTGWRRGGGALGSCTAACRSPSPLGHAAQTTEHD